MKSWKLRAVKTLSSLLRPGLSAGCAAAFLRAPLRLVRPRADVAARNLEVALPDRTPAERKTILDATYDHLVWTAIESVVMQKDPRQVLDWVEGENAEALRALEGQGAILLTAHVGNWELTAAWIAQQGYPLTAIVRESDDQSERKLVESMRAHVGVTSLPKSAPMRQAVSVLRRGEFLGILPDQHGGPEGLPSTLFGVETSTSQGPAVFALLTRKPLIPVFSRRIAPFRHQIRVGAPIAWEEKTDRDATIRHITEQVNRTVERMIREAPGQWLAQHRRFRERCGG
jgi:Lauroyl/myristoyl acyltransferase